MNPDRDISRAGLEGGFEADLVRSMRCGLITVDPGSTVLSVNDLAARVLEIDPVMKQVVWEFKQPRLSEDLDGDGKILGNEKLFFSNLMSGMQRLPNGNTLICESDPGRIFEVTKSGKVVWEYAPTWARAEGMFGGAVYRAYRIPYEWVPEGVGN